MTITQEVQIVITYTAHDEQGNHVEVFQDQQGRPAPSLQDGARGPLTREFFDAMFEQATEGRKAILKKLRPRRSRKTEGVSDGNQSETAVPAAA